MFKLRTYLQIIFFMSLLKNFMSKKKTIKDFEVIVIGGGASGMMAAISAASNHRKVLIIEKMPRLGRKLSISGGGRCNITNNTLDTREFLKKFDKAADFLYSPFSQFGVKDTFTFFEKNKLPLVTEARDRVFPKSQKASDVVKCMINILRSKNVSVLLDTSVIKFSADKETTLIKSVETKDYVYEAKHFILATGGTSHPETGSTGDGFKFLKKLGHTVLKPTPNIVPLKVKDKWIKSISGVSLSFMKITFFVNDKKAFSKTGKILFTHFGLSSPLILNSAKMVADLLHAGPVTAKIDCYPDTNSGALEEQIIKIFDKNKNRDFKNVISEIAPKGLDSAILILKPIEDVNKKIHSITKEERKQIVQLLKNMPVEIIGLMGMEKAVVSDGGIPLKEVDTKTMKSKLYKNLYMTGDLLHVNRPSGGYSLQLCWTTGYVAGLTK